MYSPVVASILTLPWPAGIAPVANPWHVRRYRDATGLPIIGTAAPPLPTTTPAAPRAFSGEDLERVNAVRGPAARKPLAPPLAALGLVLLLGAWCQRH